MITFVANGRTASYTSTDVITAGSVGIPVQFTLSEDFDGLSPIVVFEGSGTAVDVALVDNACVVPHEVVATAGGYLKIAIYARNGEGTIVIPTIWGNTCPILPGAAPSDVDPSQPTPDWTAQVQQIATDAYIKAEQAEGVANDAKSAAITAQDSAQASAEAAQTAREGAEAAQGFAETAESNARGFASDAAGSAGGAAAAKTAAETAEGLASGYATDALNAKNAAVAAKEAAVTAQGKAEQAQGNAEGYATTAGNKAGEAAQSASDALGYKNTAVSKAGEAANSATSAGNSATTANADALKAEGFAVGEQNGTPVASGSLYHQNNAKYYAEQAEAAASDTDGSIREAFVKNTITNNGVLSFTDGAAVSTKTASMVAAPYRLGSGTASSENPRPIAKYVGAQFRVTGKNLWGGQDMVDDIKSALPSASQNTQDKTISFSSAWPANHSFVSGCFKPNTRYTFIITTRKSTGNGTNIGVVYSDGTYTQIVNTTASKATKVYVSQSNKTVSSLIKYNSSGSTYLYYDESGIFEGVHTAEDFEPYIGQSFAVNWGSDHTDVYGFEADLPNGVLKSTYGHIASYNGETITGPWVSSMDEYVAGATPTTGAEVVYPLDTPVEYSIPKTPVRTLHGQNYVWAYGYYLNISSASCPRNGTSYALTYGVDPNVVKDELSAEIATKANASTIAIVCSGDTAPQAITAGQYLVWQGALYTATVNIASGEALSTSTNVAAVPDGGLNALQTQIDVLQGLHSIKKYGSYTFPQDALSMAGNAIQFEDTEIGLYEELIIVVYQSDTVSHGQNWSSDANWNSIAIRDVENDGYIAVSELYLAGNMPGILRIKRFPGCTYCTTYGNSSVKSRAYPHPADYRDKIRWVSLSAPSGKTIYAGCTVEAYIARAY